MEPARGLGHLQAPRARGAGQRGRLHQSPGHGRAAGPGRPGGAPVPAGRAPCMRSVRAAGWNQPGPTAGPPTGAATATPAPPSPIPPGRRTTYLREDQILPHLAALAILRAESGTPDRARRAGITAPARAADLIDQLRSTASS